MFSSLPFFLSSGMGLPRATPTTEEPVPLFLSFPWFEEHHEYLDHAYMIKHAVFILFKKRFISERERE